MTTFCGQCGGTELCEICHDSFYDSHPFSTGEVAVKVVSSIQQGSKNQESQMAKQVQQEIVIPQTRFIHSHDKSAELSSFGKMYYRNGFTCAFIEANDTKVLIGLAFCGGNDIFNRRIGRMIAEGRMQKRPIILTKDASESAYSVAKEYAMDAYFGENEEFDDPVGDNSVEAVEGALG